MKNTAKSVKPKDDNVLDFPYAGERSLRFQLPLEVEAEIIPNVAYCTTSGKNAWILTDKNHIPVGYFFRIVDEGERDVQVRPL